MRLKGAGGSRLKAQGKSVCLEPSAFSLELWSIVALFVLCFALPQVGHTAKPDYTETPDFLYQMAQELLKAGRKGDAIHELHKLLMIAPDHVQAKQQLALLEPASQSSAVTTSPIPQASGSSYDAAFNRGIEAFRRGDVNDAVRAFQDAYLIRPTDPKLLSWLSLVKDEQRRRTAMTRTIEDVQRGPQPAAQEATRREPFWKRLTMPRAVPAGIEQTVTPVTESRPEILSETKRAGFQRLYKEGIGFQPIRGLGFSGRTEIYEEPDPVEALVLDAKKLNFSEISQYRRSVLPLFTRSAAGRVVADYEPWPRMTYEYDAREVLHQYQTQFGFKDIDLQTHAVNALYTFPRMPLVGLLTVNL